MDEFSRLLFLAPRVAQVETSGIDPSILCASIIIALSTMFIWIGLELWVGSKLSIWDAALTKPTLIWAIGSGGVLFFNCQSAGSKPHFFRQTMMGTVGVVVFVQYFVNLHSMSLLAELLLQGLILAATLMILGAQRRPEFRRAERFLELLLGLVMLGLVAYSARQLYLDWYTTQLTELALEFSLPIWLTLGLLPYIYLLAAVMAYELAFRLLNSFHPNRHAHWLAHASLLISFRLSIRQLRKFRNYWLNQLAQTSNITQARKVIGEFRRYQAKLHRKSLRKKCGCVNSLVQTQQTRRVGVSIGANSRRQYVLYSICTRARWGGIEPWRAIPHRPPKHP